MGLAFDWDVFLSHAAVDKPRVARLAERLEAGGLRVWFDRAEIDPGADIVAGIEHGFDHSRVVVLCMSATALISEWVRIERNMALFRDPGNNDRRFLPLLFEDCRIPALLRRVKYIDWCDESKEAWRELLAALAPDAPPLPEVENGPFNPYDPYTLALGSGFVGRANELRRLHNAMEEIHSVSLVGDWRIGKTSLLAAFESTALQAGRVVRTLTGEGPEGRSLAAMLVAVTGRCIPASDPDKTLDPDTAAERLRQWARQHTHGPLRPLLIVDEAEVFTRIVEHRFLERLRGLVQAREAILIWCTRLELDRLYQQLGRTSPFGNTLRQERLALLDEASVESLLGWNAGVLCAEDLSLIREWAGRHPYFIQLLAYELVDARRSGASQKEALDRFVDTAQARLRELWKVLDETDRQALQLCAENGRSDRRSLRLRGLTGSDGRPFGHVLTDWLTAG
ncbi:MAG: TIR domain-containing protein [Gammaproteobacteria bacterium]|nr:TIR domain-containing protein [Gammaproteobacteria bacterium]